MENMQFIFSPEFAEAISQENTHFSKYPAPI